MNKKALVVGLGVSGKSACAFLLRQGYEVVGVDAKDRREDPEVIRLVELGVSVLKESEWREQEPFALTVPSPGIAFSHPILAWSRETGSRFVGEAQLALEALKDPIVAVTGTNGKTTVTLLVTHILQRTGRPAIALGNVGVPLTSYVVQQEKGKIVVAELSSYQLETLSSPVFKAGVLLNITPDHLDRYEDMTAYAKAKIGMEFCLQQEGKLFISSQVHEEFSSLFSRPYHLLEDLSLPLEYQALHDRQNALAAWALCREFGVDEKSFLRELATFQKPPHRIEFVMDAQGVSYYDDSKGTNIDAVIQAVQAMKGPVILLGGGVDKGSSYLPWKALQGKVKQMFVFGMAAPKMESELSLFFNVRIVDSLEEAVKCAVHAAQRGDCVLLSPGCSSFDMFRDYAHRGQEFQRLVRSLVCV